MFLEDMNMLLQKTIISDTPAVDSVVKQAQFFCEERRIGSRCIPYEIWQTVCKYTGKQHQKKGNYGQLASS